MKCLLTAGVRPERIALVTRDEPAYGPTVLAVAAQVDFRPGDRARPNPPEPDPRPEPAVSLVTPLPMGLSEVPATALGDYAACPKRFRYRWVDGHPGLAEGEASARKIGTLTHLALERDIDDLEVLAGFDTTLERAQIEEALALAQCFKEAPEFESLQGTGAECEVPVELRIGELQVNGVIDRLTPESVVDFKTDRQMEPEHHRLQLWVYAEATGRREAHVAYLRHRRVHPYAAEELAAAGEEARRIATGIAGGAFTAIPSLHACGVCVYRAVCDEAVGDAVTFA